MMGSLNHDRVCKKLWWFSSHDTSSLDFFIDIIIVYVSQDLEIITVSTWDLILVPLTYNQLNGVSVILTLHRHFGLLETGRVQAWGTGGCYNRELSLCSAGSRAGQVDNVIGLSGLSGHNVRGEKWKDRRGSWRRWLRKEKKRMTEQESARQE